MKNNNTTIIWRRLVPQKTTDTWLERLRCFVGEERIIETEFPLRRTTQIDVFCKNFSEAKKLRQLYAGKIQTLKKSSWLSTQKRNFSLPLPPYLCIASEKSAIPKKYHRLIPIIIPAGIAFGTGEHATTGMCLHQLLKLNLPRKSGILDAGTGSGILALAAATLGYRVTAIDNDPSCIRESKANASRNSHVPPIRWKISSVEKFVPAQKFDGIIANLYAEILISSMSRFKKLLKPDGYLILSGILKNQANDMIDAIHSAKLTLLKKLRRGKWICLVARK